MLDAAMDANRQIEIVRWAAWTLQIIIILMLSNEFHWKWLNFWRVLWWPRSGPSDCCNICCALERAGYNSIQLMIIVDSNCKLCKVFLHLFISGSTGHFNPMQFNFVHLVFVWKKFRKKLMRTYVESKRSNWIESSNFSLAEKLNCPK